MTSNPERGTVSNTLYYVSQWTCTLMHCWLHANVLPDESVTLNSNWPTVPINLTGKKWRELLFLFILITTLAGQPLLSGCSSSWSVICQEWISDIFIWKWHDNVRTCSYMTLYLLVWSSNCMHLYYSIALLCRDFKLYLALVLTLSMQINSCWAG